MNPWYLVIALCLVDGFLCHELMETWDKKEHGKDSKGPRSKGEK